MVSTHSSLWTPLILDGFVPGCRCKLGTSLSKWWGLQLTGSAKKFVGTRKWRSNCTHRKRGCPLTIWLCISKISHADVPSTLRGEVALPALQCPKVHPYQEEPHPARSTGFKTDLHQQTATKLSWRTQNQAQHCRHDSNKHIIIMSRYIAATLIHYVFAWSV